MSKATQLVGIILLGIITLVIFNLMNDARSTDELDYYLLQEVTEASMYDAVDYSYYRETGLLKVDRDMFLESFNRRFAQSVAGNRDYDIKIIDFNETPPKASISVTAPTVAEVKGEVALITNKVSGIIETIYDNLVMSRGEFKRLGDATKPEIKIVATSSGACDIIITDDTALARYAIVTNPASGSSIQSIYDSLLNSEWIEFTDYSNNFKDTKTCPSNTNNYYILAEDTSGNWSSTFDSVVEKPKPETPQPEPVQPSGNAPTITLDSTNKKIIFKDADGDLAKYSITLEDTPSYTDIPADKASEYKRNYPDGLKNPGKYNITVQDKAGNTTTKTLKINKLLLASATGECFSSEGSPNCNNQQSTNTLHSFSILYNNQTSFKGYSKIGITFNLYSDWFSNGGSTNCNLEVGCQIDNDTSTWMKLASYSGEKQADNHCAKHDKSSSFDSSVKYADFNIPEKYKNDGKKHYFNCSIKSSGVWQYGVGLRVNQIELK